MEMSLSEVVPLLEAALRGELTSVELNRAWPHAVSDSRLSVVREDLKSAVEHMPATDEDPTQVDLRRWRSMPEYRDLELHLANLRGAA